MINLQIAPFFNGKWYDYKNTNVGILSRRTLYFQNFTRCDSKYSLISLIIWPIVWEGFIIVIILTDLSYRIYCSELKKLIHKIKAGVSPPTLLPIIKKLEHSINENNCKFTRINYDEKSYHMMSVAEDKRIYFQIFSIFN